MEKIKTNSYFVTICKTKRKIFIQRRKRRGLHPYPRTLTLNEINKYLGNTEIKYPKLLWNGFKYVNEEFIEATQDINSLSNLEIMEHIINVISDLYKIDVKNKKITWANNSEFLKFNIKNLKEVLIHKNSLELNDYIFEIDNLFENLDNNRKLCFIHGDIHKKNMIINNDSFYLIDWELSTYGDLAYELAIHFILMDYTENEKVVFLSKLSELITLDFEKLKSDIEVYINFELYRRNVLKLIKEQ